MLGGLNQRVNRCNAAVVGALRSAGSFAAKLRASLVPERSVGSGTPTYGRNLAAYVPDFEGRQVLVPANAARFAGARVVQNLAPNSDFQTGWTSVRKTIASGISDPFGGTGAYRLTATGANGDTYVSITVPSGATCRSSFWIRRVTGTGVIETGIATSVGTTLAVTPSWQRFSELVTVAGTTAYLSIRIDTSGDAIDVYGPQMEVVTGQSNQNPSEYVSVGVLSAPYHGAGVDGVKYFSTLNGNTVSSNVVTESTGLPISSATAKFAQFSSAATTTFTTPAATANQITSDIDFRAAILTTTYSGYGTIFSRRIAAVGSTESYAFRRAGANLEFLHNNGSTQTIKTSDATLTQAVNTKYWVRCTWQQSSGDIKFYTSQDGVTWVQLGNTIAGPTTAMNVGTRALTVGADADNGLAFDGRIYRAQIFSTIGGTVPVVDFNPNDHSSGATFASSTTGETWTINGNAKIFGSNADATYGIPAQWDSGGPFGYLAEGSRQNVEIWSEGFFSDGPTWPGLGIDVIRADASIASPSGAITGSKITEQATGTNLSALYHSTNLALNTVHTYSIFAKYGTRQWCAIALYNATIGDKVSYFDLVNGVTGTTAAGTTTTIKPYPNGWYRLTFTFTSDAGTTAHQFRFELASADGTNNYLASSKYLYIYGAQVEAASFASTYIPTTTTAVTRPADVDSYATASNITTNNFVVAGSTTFPTVPPAGNYYLWGSYVDASNSTSVYWNGTNLTANRRIGGTDHKATKALTPVSGTAFKWAARFSSSTGTDIFVAGAVGTNDATNTACQIAATMQIGADGNGANQPFAETRNFQAWTRALADGQIAAL